MRRVHLVFPPLLLLLTACGGGGGTMPAVQNQAPSLAPVVSAGPDQAVVSGAAVLLDGSASLDPAGLPLTYAWTAPAGIALSSPTAARPSFTAPVVAAGLAPASLAFSLVVNNGQASSAPALVTITVAPAAPSHPPPIASAGPNQSVASGALVTLDGSLSQDPGGQALSFAWTQVGGPALALSGAATAHPAFTAPVVPLGSAALTLSLSLVVNNGTAASTPAAMAVTVNPAGAAATPPAPGTPAPAPPDPNQLPVGGSGSKRWQIGAVGGGLYLADPAASEASVQGLVIVTLDKGFPPADTVVTINGVALGHAPLADGRYFSVAPSGPQPPVHPGGRMVLAASSASAGVERQLVLPCAADLAVGSAPAAGSSLAGVSSLQLTFSADLTLNAPGIPALAGVSPTVTLCGYDPVSRVVTFGSPQATAPGQQGLTVPVGASSAPAWLLEIRWPGLFIPDGGDSGAFCGLVKRWTHTK